LEDACGEVWNVVGGRGWGDPQSINVPITTIPSNYIAGLKNVPSREDGNGWVPNLRLWKKNVDQLDARYHDSCLGLG
jgi:hypothetical protein